MGDLKAMIVGGFIGDALGVPVEFTDRETLRKTPVTGMLGYGTHNQPMGTWSDDSSMVWCTVDTIVDGYSTEMLGKRFLLWLDGSYTPHGVRFDIGMTTYNALIRLSRTGQPAELCGGARENDNGNGSLMRCAPMVVPLSPLEATERFKMVEGMSSITHAHPRSVLGCYWLCEYLIALDSTGDKHLSYALANAAFNALPDSPDKDAYARVTSGDIHTLPDGKIKSSGYVVDTLECALYCLLTTDDFATAVLKAVNYGMDTDTAGSIVGNMAGLHYGMSSIPENWLNTLVRGDEVVALGHRLQMAASQVL
jgi:ADP-ribosyl-[dinitrogen reductase] hydrolase